MTAARSPADRPPWCGECDERTRQIELDDGRAARCLRCHPLRTAEEADAANRRAWLAAYGEPPPKRGPMTADQLAAWRRALADRARQQRTRRARRTPKQPYAGYRKPPDASATRPRPLPKEEQ